MNSWSERHIFAKMLQLSLVEKIGLQCIIEKQHKSNDFVHTHEYWKHFFQSFRKLLKQEMAVDLKE